MLPTTSSIQLSGLLPSVSQRPRLALACMSSLTQLVILKGTLLSFSLIDLHMDVISWQNVVLKLTVTQCLGACMSSLTQLVILKGTLLSFPLIDLHVDVISWQNAVLKLTVTQCLGACEALLLKFLH